MQAKRSPGLHDSLAGAFPDFGASSQQATKATKDSSRPADRGSGHTVSSGATVQLKAKSDTPLAGGANEQQTTTHGFSSVIDSLAGEIKSWASEPYAGGFDGDSGKIVNEAFGDAAGQSETEESLQGDSAEIEEQTSQRTAKHRFNGRQTRTRPRRSMFRRSLLVAFRARAVLCRSPAESKHLLDSMTFHQ